MPNYVNSILSWHILGFRNWLHLIILCFIMCYKPTTAQHLTRLQIMRICVNLSSSDYLRFYVLGRFVYVLIRLKKVLVNRDLVILWFAAVWNFINSVRSSLWRRMLFIKSVEPVFSLLTILLNFFFVFMNIFIFLDTFFIWLKLLRAGLFMWRAWLGMKFDSLFLLLSLWWLRHFILFYNIV